jgi:hypothetical protein
MVHLSLSHGKSAFEINYEIKRDEMIPGNNVLQPLLKDPKFG